MTSMRSENQLARLIAAAVWDEPERIPLAKLMARLAELPPPPDPGGDFPRYAEYLEHFRTAAAGDDGDALEETFLTLYAHLHMHEARYTADERALMDEAGGYWAHAGGLAPVLRAGPFIREDTVSADFGAGNGLQGLLFQVLYPHRRTVQIEISSRMVEIGKRLQGWLGIPKGRVEWIADDVCNHTPVGMDFIYLYRPVRPGTEAGRGFYERFAATLAAQDRPVTIFSIADCLRDFLPSSFEVFHCDGHLTCFRRVEEK